MKYPTITSLFIVPILEIPKQERIDNGFIDGFINETITEYEFSDCVFLLFKPLFPSRFRKFVNKEYESEREILYDYDIENGFSILVYRLNPKYIEDFYLIKQSKYSQTSIEFQKKFPENTDINNEKIKVIINGKSLQYSIFNKTPELRKYIAHRDALKYFSTGDPELWFDFKLEAETLSTLVLKDIISEKNSVKI